MESLDAKSYSGNVDFGLCGKSATLCDEDSTGEREMSYLSHVVNQRPTLRVSGEILLAFCCATPLVLLLCFLV